MLPFAYFCWTSCIQGALSDNDEDMFLAAYLSGLVVFVSMKTIVVIHEVSTSLEIFCFDIVTSYSEIESTPSYNKKNI